MSSLNNISQDFFDNINNFASNPFILVVLIGIILVYYLLFAFLGSSGSDGSSSSGGILFIEALLWGLFILLIFVNGISYFYGVNVITEMKSIFSGEPEIQIETTVDISNVPIILDDKEVYHIPGNKFTYHDAKAVCNAFDGEMATYEQLRDGQTKGSSWCSYGWAKDQLGLYPTSQNTWEKLKQKEGHEYDCGLPGVNGGYISNPHTRLGANCYGIKPKKSELEKQYLDNQELYPKTQKELLFEERVKYWKTRIGNILVMPFNNDSWYKVDDIKSQNEKMIADSLKAQQEAEALAKQQRNQATVAGARSEASRASAEANRKAAQAINPETSDLQLFLNNNL